MAFDTTIDYITTASTGNASDFGDTTLSKRNASGCSNGTYGMSCGGYSGVAATGEALVYVTIASTGDSANWGEISSAQYGATQQESGAISGHTRGVMWAASSALSNIIEYWTWASTGDTSDFGDVSQTTGGTGDAGTEDTVRGMLYTIGGEWSPSGQGSVNIEYITMATTGNSVDFGDATESTSFSGSFSNGTRAESWAGKWYTGGSYVVADHIEYVTIASTGNGTDQGNLDVGGFSFACAEGSA